MAVGTLRFWAAAKAAAGTAEEPYDADTLGAALAAAAARHGAALEQVLARCSFLVDGVRATPQSRLTEGGTVEVLPPFAGGAHSSGGPADPAGSAARDPLTPLDRAFAAPLVAGTVSLALALVVVAGAYSGRAALAGVVGITQLLLVAGWYALAGAPGRAGGSLLVLAASAVADAVLAARTAAPVLAPVTGVLGIGVVLAFAHQLARRGGRPRVTASLTATVCALGVCLAASLLVAAPLTGGGPAVAAATVLGAGIGAVAAAVPVADPVRIVAAGLAGGLAGSLLAVTSPTLGAGPGAAVGAVGGLAAGIATLAGRDLRPPRRSAHAKPPLFSPVLPSLAALPVVLAAPVAYVLGRILVG